MERASAHRNQGAHDPKNLISQRLSSASLQRSRSFMRRNAPASQSPAVDMSFLHASLGFNVRLLDVRLMKMFAASLAKFGVTPAEATVLHVIMANPDVGHGELAE